MAEGTPSPFPSERHRSDDSPRGERTQAPREGGFRIRLSDNEMRSARALQEAFGLRSTVAVLGFALRTLGQQLEEGKLAELVEQHRSQAPARGASGDGGGRSEGRRERPEGRGSGGRWQEGRGGAAGGGRSARVDPFARPPRPEAAPEAPPEAEPSAAEPEVELAGDALSPDLAPQTGEATPAEAIDTPADADALPSETAPATTEPADA
ncbi:MAG: hypothetical protein VKO39_12470 [Cyanobacteriota bacterium]|nr:hypothetical protein [Cyanobacteriota bacterium]